MAYTVTNITNDIIGIAGQVIPPLTTSRYPFPALTAEMIAMKKAGLIEYSGYNSNLYGTGDRAPTDEELLATGSAISEATVNAASGAFSSEPTKLIHIMKSAIDPEFYNPSGRWNSDDTSKIQAAIQQSSDEGRTIKLRKTYTTDALVLLPGTRMEGDAVNARFDGDNVGAGLRRKRNSTAGYHLSLYDQTNQTAWNGQGVELYNFALYGDKGYQIPTNACGGVSISHLGGAGGGSFIPRHRVKGLFIRDTNGTGFEIGPFTRDGYFDDMIVYGANGYGLLDGGVDSSRQNWNIGQSFCDGVRSTAHSVRYANFKSWGSGQYNLASTVSPIITDEATGAAFDAINAANFFFFKTEGVTAAIMKSQEATNYGIRIEGQGSDNTIAFQGYGFESDGDCRMNSVSGTRAGINIFRAPGIQLEAFVGKLNPAFVGGPHSGISISTNSQGGRIMLTTSGINSFPVDISGTEAGNNEYSINGHRSRIESLPYSSSITPSWQNGRLKTITLTGNVTINAPSRAATGEELEFIFLQDGTGGRTVTWNAVFLVSWTPVTTAGKRNHIRFRFDGANWVQVGSVVGL